MLLFPHLPGANELNTPCSLQPGIHAPTPHKNCVTKFNPTNNHYESLYKGKQKTHCFSTGFRAPPLYCKSHKSCPQRYGAMVIVFVVLFLVGVI